MSCDADVLCFNRTPGLMRVAGVIPLLLGSLCILLALLPVLGVPVSVKIGDWDRETALRLFVPALAAVGLTLAAAGALMIWSHWETVIDRRRGIIVRRWTCGTLRREKTRPLEEMTHAALRYSFWHSGETIEGSSESTAGVGFQVFLCGGNAEVAVTNLRAGKPGKVASRRDADQLAAFLRLGIHDQIPPDVASWL